MIMTEPGGHSDARRSAATSAPLLSRSAGPLAIAAGTLLIVGQAIWWPFDQQKNLATAQNDIFNAGSVIYFCGFCVLMFALIGVHGKQAYRAGRLGTFGFCTAVLGTMFLGGGLWFESFAVPWLAEGPFPQVLQSDPSILFALGAISSYLLFAIGWVSFGVASLRARVFPVWISIFIVIGGIAGYKALLSPWGISPRLGCSDTWWVDAAPSFRGHDQFKPWSSRTTATTANCRSTDLRPSSEVSVLLSSASHFRAPVIATLLWTGRGSRGRSERRWSPRRPLRPPA